MKYIAYCRKSTDEKDKQLLSIEAQIAELKEFAKREHLEVADYVTEAKTAKVPGREKFDEVLKRIECGEAQGILSWHPDRLARNSIDGGKVIYLLDTGKLLDLKFPSFWFESTPPREIYAFNCLWPVQILCRQFKRECKTRTASKDTQWHLAKQSTVGLSK